MAAERGGPDIPAEVKKGDADVQARLAALGESERSAVIATVDKSGAPYTSLVSFAYMPQRGAVAFATPRRSAKYANLLAEPRVSIMLDSRPGKAGGASLLRAEAVTVIGTARPLRRGRGRDEASAALKAKYPELAEFVEAATTAVMLVDVHKAVHVSGFQRVTVWERMGGKRK